MDRRPQPTITIDPTGTVPVRRQIVDQLRSAIVEGALRPGDELPSVRRLAVDLGVHFNTVAEAYRLLAAEEWLEVLHGRGARVLQRAAPAVTDTNNKEAFRQRLRHLAAEMRASGFTVSGIRGELLSILEGLK